MVERLGIEEGDEDEEEEEEEMVVITSSEKEEKCCQQFLKCFLIGSESTFLDSIDLILMLQAMPVKIPDYNLEKVKLYNFSVLQLAIIAYLNED